MSVTPTKALIDISKLENLADKIRAKTGTSDLMTVDEMATAVENIGGLPSEYEAVEYIESTGTQYIDTGYIATPATNIECEIYADSNTPTWYCAWGSYTSTASFQLMLKNSESRFEYYTGNGSVYFLACYNQKIKFMTSYTGAQWDAEDGFSSASRSSSHTTTYSLGIFAGHESDGFNAGVLMRCYYFKIFEAGNLVRNFVPCIRKSDDEAGLYDLVNGVFYTNAGTGDFVVPSV